MDLLSGAGFRWAVIVLAPIVLGLLAITKSFPGLWDMRAWDAMDAAQTARNLARDGHFVTDSIRPASLVFRAQIEGHPDLYNEPLYPSVLAAVFRVWSAGDKPVAATGVLLWLVTLWLTIGFAKRLFGWRIANLTGLLLAINIAALGAAISGTRQMLAVPLIMVTLWLLYRPDPGAEDEEAAAPRPLPPWRLIAAGVALGLATLTLYSLVLVVIPALVYALFEQRKEGWWRGLILLAGWAVALVPWAVRNQVVTGSPVFTLQLLDVASNTPTYPGDSAFRSMDPDVVQEAMPFTFAWNHLGEVMAKVKGSVRGLPSVVPADLGSLIAAFFLASVFFTPPDRGIVRLRRCFYGMFFAHFAVLSVTRLSPSDLLVYVPFALVLSAYGMRQLIGAIELDSIRRGWQTREWRVGAQAVGRIAILVVILGFVALPFSTWLRTQSGASARVAVPKFEALRPTAQPPPLVMSDVPQAIAWYCDRPTVWLTQRSREYDRLSAVLEPVKVLHFQGRALSLAPAEVQNWWAVAYRTGMPYKGLVPIGSLDVSREEEKEERVLVDPELRPRFEEQLAGGSPQ
jgi:4-amino-4-deoxy-L-arabinose transferase-like glycosyltransferase